jgi:hypothetical protein
MARTRLSWLALILLTGCMGGIRMEGMTSETQDDTYWAREREKCYQVVDDIMQKKCLDAVANARRHGLEGH